MDDAGQAVLITFLVILFILFCFWLRCCYLQRRFVSPLEKLSLLHARLTSGRTRVELMVKRCDQDTTNVVENRIMYRLKQDMQHKGLQLDERSWDRALDDGRKPVLVFCVISSRIGTDIETAMRGVLGRSRVILVILHCKLKSLLTGKLSDEEDLLDLALRDRMTGIAHFAFSEREGLYDCRQNTDGFQMLLDAVNSLP